MNKIVTVILCWFVSTGIACSQADKTIEPKSFYVSAHWSSLQEVALPGLSAKETDELDYNDAKNGLVPRIARNISTDLGLESAGSWSILPGGDRVWRLLLSSAGAQALIPLFDRLYLPPGASLHLYMPGKQETLGAFTHANTVELRSFCPGFVHGETCVIEYYEPASQKGKGILHLDRVGYAYRWIQPLEKDLKSLAGPCEVNVICPEGDNWRDQIRSVVRVFVVDSVGEAWCSGSLVNNVRQDCTPYILSADHCTGDGVSKNDFLQWIFYFNYQTDSCNGVTGPTNQTVNGCKKIALSNDGGGQSGSDFLLLQLNAIPPSSYNVFYAGWNNTTSAASSGVDVHHPESDIKKISTFNSPAIPAAWGNIAQHTHWVVTWSPTTDGDGVTEPGSSGSPLINQAGLIVGHLTGGSSCCTAGGCGGGSGPTGADFFGQLAYDWTSNGAVDSLQLKPWLDPDNTGTSSLAGMNPPCGSSLLNDAGIQAIDVPNGTVCNPDFNPTVVLRNFGANTLHSVSIDFKFDSGNTVGFSWSGSIAAGGSLLVNLPSVTLAQGSHYFLCFTSEPNGTADSNNSNDTLSSDFYVTNEGGSMMLNLTTDDEGSKTTWQFTDANNNVVASGGPYPNLVGGEEYNISLCLPVACYTYSIFSADANGMVDGENGGFSITNAAGTEAYASLSNPSFGSQEVHSFCLNPSGIQTIDKLSMSIIPNPSTGLFHLSFDNNNERIIRLFDIVGRLIMSTRETETYFTLDCSAQIKGVYVLQVEGAEGKAIQKLVLK